MKVEGVIKLIKEMQVFDSGFMKQEIVVETKDKYPQLIPIEFIKDKTNLLQDVAEGMSVSVSINIRGREWTSPKGEVKHFLSLEGWRIDAEHQAEASQPAPVQAAANQAPVMQEGDGLPF